MILAAMSNYFMSLADRIILSKYSTEAFVAAAGSHPFYWANTRAMMAFIIMTSVFIGQFHGARNFSQISKIVWQTILISFLNYIVLIPFALYSKVFLAAPIEDLGAPYLSIMLMFLPFHLAGFGAISSFFLGIGHTKIVPIVILASNVINIVLDFLFIFGWGFIPAMGIKGAALATGISQVIAFFIFLYEFLKLEYREQFETHKPKISIKLLKKTLPLGIPNSLNSILNSGGFAIVYQIIAKVCSADDLLAFSIANSIYMFFWFFIDGLGKGVCTTCSNYIGKNQARNIFKTARSVSYLLVIFSALTAIFMIFIPKITLHLFYAQEISESFFANFKWVLFWAWVALMAEGFRWMLQNMLISADDVKFTMISNISCFWIAAFIPIYFLVFKLSLGGAILCWQFFALDSCIRIISNFLRVHSETWQKKAQNAAKGSSCD